MSITTTRGEGGRTLGGDVALGGEDVVRDPFDEIGRVLGLHGLHLILDLLHGDFTTEVRGDLFPHPSVSKAMTHRGGQLTVRYRPCRGSEAAIMFLASNICCVSSATVTARYCWLPLAVRGAKPTMKK